MRILITNNTLDQRGGSELYVRDLAIGLLKRGHTPIAYSTALGEVAKEIRAATIPVIDNLDSLSLAPDIIHGQHHLETMTALLRFPRVPAVSFCHGWMPWEESPPKFPRILQYAAVDHLCRDRLILESGIPADRVRVLLNFIDLERFKPRGPLPDRPQRALILSNYATEKTHIPAVREACARHGIDLDIVGRDSGNVCAQPEEILGDYDIVFAKGRAALESLAIGAAVVLCDAGGAGPLVTASEFDQLRPLNFGVRTLREPVSADEIDRQIARYNPADAAQVSKLVRAGAGRDAVIDQIISMYQEVIEENESLATDEAAEAHAAAAYLHWLAPTLKSIYRSRTRTRDAETELAQVIGESNHLRTLILERDDAMQTFQISRKEGEDYLRGLLATSDAKIEELKLEVNAKDSQLDEVTEKLTEKQAELNRVAASLMEKEAELKTTAASLVEKEAELKTTAASLTESESQLDRINRSFGWRLLSRYGRIKHRVLLPALRVFKSRPATGSDQEEASPSPDGELNSSQ